MRTKRIVIDISEEEKVRANNLIQWGLGNTIWPLVVSQTLDMIEKHGEKFVGLFLREKIQVKDFLKEAVEVEEDD